MCTAATCVYTSTKFAASKQRIDWSRRRNVAKFERFLFCVFGSLLCVKVNIIIILHTTLTEFSAKMNRLNYVVNKQRVMIEEKYSDFM